MRSPLNPTSLPYSCAKASESVSEAHETVEVRRRRRLLARTAAVVEVEDEEGTRVAEGGEGAVSVEVEAEVDAIGDSFSSVSGPETRLSRGVY